MKKLTEAILRHKLLVAGAIVALITVGVVLHASGPVEVIAGEAIEGPLTARIAASGIVESRSSDLAFERPGRLSTVFVQEGDRVGEGDSLAWADAINTPMRGAPPSVPELVRAPYAGTIVEIYKRIGSTVNPGEPVIRIVSAERPWVTAFVESEDAVDLAVGQVLSCRGGGYLSQRWNLTVAAIGKEAVPRRGLAASSRQVRVRCEVESPAFPLPPGTEVDVDADVPLVTRATLIPTSAVISDGTGDWVWVVEGEVVRRRGVTVGRNNFDHIVIRSGVEPGDPVVVHGKLELSEGQQVKPVAAPPMVTESAPGSAD